MLEKQKLMKVFKELNITKYKMLNRVMGSGEPYLIVHFLKDIQKYILVISDNYELMTCDGQCFLITKKFEKLVKTLNSL